MRVSFRVGVPDPFPPRGEEPRRAVARTPILHEVELTRLCGELLGRMRVTVDDRPTVAAWPRPAARRLVALLLLAEDHVLGREMIAAHLFEHLEPDRAPRAVSKALSQARSALDDGAASVGGDAVARSVLAADRAAIWIAEHVVVELDVDEHLSALRSATGSSEPSVRMARLRAALDAATSPVLLNDRYEPWAQDLLAEVERARRDARFALARTTGALEDWQAAADHDPASEEACAALATRLLDAGRRQDAARVVATTEAALAELGVAIDPQLVAALGSRPPRATALDTSRSAAEVGQAPPPTPGRAPRWPLIGRERELDVVLRSTRPAAEGYGGALLLAAPAGMGKTHLLRHATARLAAEGWNVAVAASVPEDRLAPFASLRTALLAFDDQPTAPLVARVLHPDRDGGGSTPLHPADLAALADALRRHLDRLAAAQPLVLCLDDVQWADDALQRVLARLVAGFGERRWALLLAARTDEPGAAVPELPTTVDRLALRPLTRAASRVLADHAAASVGISSERQVAAITRRGQGHPFFIVELARSLPPDDGGPHPVPGDPPGRAGDAAVAGAGGPGEAGGLPDVPERIVALLRRRVGACSPAARRLTAFVAVAGEDASVELVRRNATRLVGGADVGEVVAELARAALVRELDSGLRLAHPLLREAATATIDTVRRGELHALVADALERSSRRDDDGGTVLSIARHRLAAYEVAGEPHRAAAATHAAVDGAAMARRLGVPAAATELYQRGLAAWSHVPPAAREPVRPAAFAGYVGLGAVHADAGAHDLADRVFAEGLALARTDDEVARAEQAWAQLPYRQGDLDASLARLERALDRIGDAPPTARARLVVEIGWIRYRRRTDDALTTLAGAVELAEQTDEWTLRTRALDRYAFALARLERDDAALPLFDRALSAASRSGDPREQAIVHLHHVRPLYRTGRRYEARTSLARAAELCDRHGMRYLRSVGHWIGADLAEADGDVEAALAERDAELALLRALDNPRHLAGCQAHRATLLRALGRDDEAAVAGRDAERAAARLGDPGAAVRGAWGRDP
jgi:DNA-binding SARP family transcriptional activator/tetratricopeptide (TPR) repeat protein